MAKLMLVEDDEPSRDVLTRRLARRGYGIVSASNGLESVTLARAEKPDLILMDLGLPGIDGWEATRRLKDHGATSHIPIIVLSAHAMSNDRETAIAAGADDFDTKPVRFAALLAKIELLLAKAATA